MAITVILTTTIACCFISFWIYMYYCSENEIGMFANPNYEKRIEKLEEDVKELKKE